MSVLKLQRRTVLLLASMALVVLLALAVLLTSGTLVKAADNASVISVQCLSTHQLADDPIVYPGQPGKAHMHEFIGNPSTNASTTFQTMTAAKSSVKCDTHADSSGYWAPALYKNGVRVPVLHGIFYYRGPPGVQPFPANLKMIAGGDTRSPPVPWEQARGLSWSCLDSGPFYAQPPNCTSIGKPIKAHIQFPNCWDGFRLDSPDHKSHMAYWTQNKQCPASHPVRLPRLRQNVAYNIKDGRGTYLSSDHDEPGGTQLHADFWNTWDQAVLRDAIETCINGNINCKRLKDNDPRLQ
jgi:hypothetical protein